MCAILSAVLKDPTRDDFETLKRVFVESKIRGMHATGMSFLPHWSKEIVTIREAVPADKFVETHLHNDNLPNLLNADGNLYLIGHCRYSTSDLEYNQPLFKANKSIVHNGVITQELPENWKDKYGYECETKNDSELVLHSDDPLREFPHMSMGVCELTTNRAVRFYRNGKRPLYLSATKNGCIITSTSDIAKRSGIAPIDTTEVPMNHYNTIDHYLVTTIEHVLIDGATDLQR